MLDVNPFAQLSALLSPSILQGYIILMFILVVVGTILDMAHKKSAQYFFENAEKAKKNAKRTLGGGEKVSMAVATVANEVLTSAEFASTRRRRQAGCPLLWRCPQAPESGVRVQARADRQDVP